MTRIVSYNILAGGYSMRQGAARRTEQLVKMLRSAQPDIVGLAEAVNPQIKTRPFVIEEVAQELGMRVVFWQHPQRQQSAFSPGVVQPDLIYQGEKWVPDEQFMALEDEIARSKEYQVALLTRLPIVHAKLHIRPGVLLRPLLEVCVEEEHGEQLTVFVNHLSAAFNRGRAGGHIRMREVAEILRIMEPLRAAGKPHLLMGDFNSLAPGEPFKASHLLRYVIGLDTRRNPNPQQFDGHPHLNGVVPPRLRFLNPLLYMTARSDLLCNLFDGAAYFYAPRGCIRELQTRYTDCFRRKHPHEWGFTCPSSAPAGRIDYIFASAPLAERLEACSVLTETDGVPGDQASDHLAVAATFSPDVTRTYEEATTRDRALTR